MGRGWAQPVVYGVVHEGGWLQHNFRTDSLALRKGPLYVIVVGFLHHKRTVGIVVGVDVGDTVVGGAQHWKSGTVTAGHESTQTNVVGEYTSSPWPLAVLFEKVVSYTESLLLLFFGENENLKRGLMSEKKDGSEPRGEETMERAAHSRPQVLTWRRTRR